MKLALLLFALVAACASEDAAAPAVAAVVVEQPASDQQAVSNDEAASRLLPAYETYGPDGRAVEYKNIGEQGWVVGNVDSLRGYEGRREDYKGEGRRQGYNNAIGYINGYDRNYGSHEDKHIDEEAFKLREYYERLVNGKEGKKEGYGGVNSKKNYFKGVDGEEFLIQEDSYGKGYLEPRFLFYGLIGRHGLGLQKRNLFVGGIKFPVTPEIIEPIGYRSYRKDFPYDKLDSVYSP